MTASSFYPDVSFGPLLSATFLERPNRFLVIARLAGRRVRVASRDPGRLHGLLVPGAEILVAPAAGARRRTRYTLTLVRRGRRWVCLVPALANRILESALRRGGVPGLEGARILRREVLRGRSRFDFLLSYNGSRLLTEIKSVTFVTRRRALFPDAPTVRGVRHVRELMAYRRGALVVFVVQRSDADSVTPFAARDPAFAAVLAAAVKAGVRVLAFACRVTRKGVRLVRAIPVRL
jgi:sugar fermentation stimulation protein A